MDQFTRISIVDGEKMLANSEARVVDIRDEQSFVAGHIEGAFHLTNGTLHTFMQETDFDTPVIVCCYHGISSQQAAQFLIHQGFEQVYSLDGGFETWRMNYPVVSGDPQQ